MRIPKRRLVVVLIVTGLVALASSAGVRAQMPHMDKGKQHTGPPAPIRITMDALHAQGGIPSGWKLLIPAGDPAEGRKVFAAMECFECHEVKNETFPQGEQKPGPELTGMGGHHPAEYLAESILNPNRVILQGPGYTGSDGLSRMPEYADTMTLRQLIDVVAYLKSLTGSDMRHGGHEMGGAMKMK